MQIFRGAPAPADCAATALTIGNFDGVHRGHQALLAQVVLTARARGLTPAVMTFEPHPRELFAPASAPPRIANLRDTVGALAGCGIERVFVQHFHHRFAALSPQRFISEVLVAGCRARWLAVGDDFRFGARRAGDTALLQASAAAAGFEVAQLRTVSEEGQRISSSLVRAALAAGDLVRVRQLLGRAYVISLGLRPTVDDSGRWLLEVHLFDFGRSVYGQLVEVELVQKLRDEEKYDSVERLRTAIAADAARARALLHSR